MNKHFCLLFSLHVFFISISFSSCTKTGCTDSSATNFETKAAKDDGTCKYTYESFTGTYQMKDTTTDLFGVTVLSNYELIIIYTGIVNEIELQNLSNSGENFKATIHGNNLTIPPQGNLSVGEGIINGNKIRIAFSYNNFTCVGTGVKQ